MTLPQTFLDDYQLASDHLNRPQAKAEHRFSSTQVEAQVDPGAISLARLQQFASRTNFVGATVRSGSDFSARFEADSSSTFVLQSQTGSLDAVALEAVKANDALTSGDFYTLFSAIDAPSLTVAMILRCPLDDAAFVWSEPALFSMTETWVDLARLFSEATQIYVMDAGDEVVSTASLNVTGRDAAGIASKVAPPLCNLGGRDLAPPSHFVPLSSRGMANIADALRRLAVGVLWTRMGGQSVSTQGTDLQTSEVILTIDAPHEVRVNWPSLPASTVDAKKSADLWQWLDGDDGAARLESARQAAAATIRDASDLDGAAAMVLTQARFIYDLSRRHAVAAIVEARTAARVASQAAANAAATEARVSARTIADRTVAAVIAALAVMITYQSEALSKNVAVLVLLAISAGIIASVLQVVLFEFPTTRSALTAAMEELRITQRHVLLKEDLSEIVEGSVVADAKATVRSAYVVALSALGVATLTVAVGFLVVASVTPIEKESPPAGSTIAPPESTTPITTDPATTTGSSPVSSAPAPTQAPPTSGP